MIRTAPSFTLTPAERARTVIASASTLRAVAPDLTLDVHRHGVSPDGSVLFQIACDTAEDLTAYRITVTVIDVATVPQPDRLRGTVTLAGLLDDVTEDLPAGMLRRLTGSDIPDGPTRRLVRLVPDSIALTWRCEPAADDPPTRHIPVYDYRKALPDPLLAYEATWLPHLQADHVELLAAIARYELGWSTDPTDVRALAIDRFGLVLRVTDPGIDTGYGDRSGQRDLRVSFDRTVTCGCDVKEAFATLLNRALPGAGPIC